MVDEDLTVIDGTHRIAALLSLNRTEIPCKDIREIGENEIEKLWRTCYDYMIPELKEGRRILSDKIINIWNDENNRVHENQLIKRKSRLIKKKKKIR